MYGHWSFGKRFAYHETLYRKGLAGLAYEIVINSNPVICYIMEENSMTMQTLVIAHAGFGHNHFFKNNYFYRQWTDADGILDYLSFARDYVAKCEEKFGYEAVERVLAEIKQAGAGERNLMPLLIEAARAHVSEGEIVQALQIVWGDYREVPVF